MIHGAGFDNEKYLSEQADFILERANKYEKLYLEFGGRDRRDRSLSCRRTPSNGPPRL